MYQPVMITKLFLVKKMKYENNQMHEIQYTKKVKNMILTTEIPIRLTSQIHNPIIYVITSF